MGAIIIVVLVSFAVCAIISVIEDKYSIKNWRKKGKSKGRMNSWQAQPVAKLSSAIRISRDRIACVYCGMKSSRPKLQVCCDF